MRTTLILVGKTVNKHFVELIDDYAARVKHYMGFDIITIPELKNTKNLSIDQQKQQLKMRYAYSLPYQAINLIEEKADVEDNRANFY